MRRRRLLASSGVFLSAALAGCTGDLSLPILGRNAGARVPSAELRMKEVTNTDIARNAVFHGPDPERDRLLNTTLLNGSATTKSREPPFPADRRVFHENGVHQLSYEIVGQQKIRSFGVTINPVETEDPEPADSEIVRFDELPKVDRKRLAELGFDDSRPIGVGTMLTYTPEQVGQSALVPTPKNSVIIWPNGPARFTVDNEGSYQQSTYRYKVEESIPAGTFGRQLRERYAFALSPSSEKQRSILQEATSSDLGYVVGPDSEPSDAFQSMVEQFRSATPVPPKPLVEDSESETDVSGRYIVRYDGQLYWTSLLLHNYSTETTQG